jgi:hypothetical protein
LVERLQLPPKNFRVSSFPDVSAAEEDEVVEAFRM